MHWKLIKCVYGLPSAPAQLAANVKQHMVGDQEFTRSSTEPNVYSKWAKINGKWEHILVAAWVDDFLVLSSHQQLFDNFMFKLNQTYDCSAKELEFMLGCAVYFDTDGNCHMDCSKCVCQLGQRYGHTGKFDRLPCPMFMAKI